ncbi:hypothetical protein BKA93DRAFT_501364 [Sparassis latifolia]
MSSMNDLTGQPVKPNEPPSPAPPIWAQPPFDNLSANIILRSSDNIDFCVHSVILSEASPFFKDMFSLQQPIVDRTKSNNTVEYRDGRPVITVGEDSRTLDGLLRLCYPITDPELKDLLLVRPMLEAALKYQMDEATAITRKALRSFAEKEPLRIWAIACRLRLEEDAHYAAQFTLQQTSIADSFPQEMQEITAGPYFRLLKYHRLRGAVDSNFSFLSPPGPTCTAKGQQESITAASLGFVTHPLTDIICRSSDGVEFRTLKAILTMASPVLHAFITSLQPTSHEGDAVCTDLSTDNLPILTLDEDSRTVSALLRLCYPVEAASTRIDDFSIVQSVLEAAKKYEMEMVTLVLRKQWASFVEVEPLRAYFTAVHYKFDECARQAAEKVLQRPVEDVYVSEMEGASAQTYYRLLRYCEACRSTVATALSEYRTKLINDKHISDDESCQEAVAAVYGAQSQRDYGEQWDYGAQPQRDYGEQQDYSTSAQQQYRKQQDYMYFKRVEIRYRWKRWFGQYLDTTSSWEECLARAHSQDGHIATLMEASLNTPTSPWCKSCLPLARRFVSFADDVGLQTKIAEVQLEL